VRIDPLIKHLFERVVILSGRGGTTSHRRSIEQSFDVALEASMAGTTFPTLVPTTAAPGRLRPCPMRPSAMRPLRSSTARVQPRARRAALSAAPRTAAVAAVSTPHRDPTRPERRRSPGVRRPARRSRLTRRGRVLLVLVLAVLLLATFSLGRASSDAGTPSRHAQVTHVTVRPGETMWQVATRVAPGNDPRITVQRLMDLNGMSSPELRAGQSLVIPTRG
jgi:hypothetical protein